MPIRVGGIVFLVLLCKAAVYEAIGSEEKNLVRTKRTVLQADQLNNADKELVVSTHNQFRGMVDPKATSMKGMIWDEELAALAVQHSRRCRTEHNDDRRSLKFESVGENIYIQSNLEDVSLVLSKAITSWDEEKSDYSYYSNRCSPGRVCGHYTQVVWEESYAVGCGVTSCANIQVHANVWPTGQLVVCNYGPAGNFNGIRPYNSGPESCTNCPVGYRCENNLCFEGSTSSTGMNNNQQGNNGGSSGNGTDNNQSNSGSEKPGSDNSVTHNQPTLSLMLVSLGAFAVANDFVTNLKV
ncbi:GLIPR1-like protein 1 [Clavelina lepadiformis]|uniref:GLIPR1-like protein 1 n=1 Tax=Clavelina lepadiformis TaxID=159417 RepID=UPI00404203AA